MSDAAPERWSSLCKQSELVLECYHVKQEMWEEAEGGDDC